MRIDTKHRICEMGQVFYSRYLQKTRIATEAQYLIMSYVFEQLNYRRYEWKCDSLNDPSNHAAKRLGFQFEGCFRNHMIYKGRNRDTNWYSMIDQDWPHIKETFQNYLKPENFDQKGLEKKKLLIY